MEKTKKLFGYIVVAIAALSLFFAGMTMQTISSFADDAMFRPSVEQKGAPAVTTVEVDGEEVDESVILEIEITSIKDVAKPAAELTKKEKDIKEALDEAKEEAKAKDFSEDVLKAMDEVAAKVSKDLDSKHTYTRDTMIVTDIVDIDLGTVLKEKLAKSKAEGKEGVKVSFAVAADIVLFKATGTDAWKVLKSERVSTSAAAANAAGSNDKTIVTMTDGEGILIFQEVADQETADKIMENKEANPDNPPQPEDNKCCEDCGENCPFCKFLCKDGKCYCWTAYVAIALAGVLLILVIVLIIVKAKANKVPDIQVPAEVGVDAAMGDEPGGNEPLL